MTICTTQIKTIRSTSALRTSNVPIYDGAGFTFISPTLDTTDDLNRTLIALDAALFTLDAGLNAIATSQITNYDGTPSFGCFSLTGGGSLNTIINEIGDQICVNTAAIAALNCGDIDVGGVYTAINYTPTAATLCGHIEGIDDELANITASVPTCLGSNLFTDGNSGLFETGITNMAGADFTLTQNAVIFYQGANSLRAVHGAATTNSRIHGTTTIAVTAGDEYVVKAYVYADSGNVAGGLTQVMAWDGAAEFAEVTAVDTFDSSVGANQDRWMLVQAVVQPSTNKNLTFGVKAAGLANTDVIYIDQLEVRCGSNNLATQQDLIDRFRRITCDWTIEGGNITTSAILLTVDIDDSLYEIDGSFVTIPDTSTTTSITVIATSDNYLDVTQAGAYIVTAVALGNPEPALARGRMRLFKLVTDGVGVTATTDRQNPYPFCDNLALGDDVIETRNIADLNVTGAKMENVVAGATVNIPNITFDNKGRITAASTDFNIAAPSNFDILYYDTGTSKWINANIIGTVLPTGVNNQTLRYNAGGALEASSLLTIEASGVGINTGAIDGSAVLDITSTTQGILIPRMTTAQRNLIGVPATSLFIFNTTTAQFEFYNGAIWTSISGSIGGAGTVNQIALFTAANSVGDSIMAESVNIIQVAGGLQVDSGVTTSALDDASSTALIQFDDLGNNDIILSSDSGALAAAYAIVQDTKADIGFGSLTITVEDDVATATNNAAILARENTTNSVDAGTMVSHGVIINSASSSIDDSIAGVVILGADNITATVADTVYTPDIETLDVLPRTDDTYSLGSAGKRWANLFMGSVIDYATQLDIKKATVNSIRFTSDGTTETISGLNTNLELDIANAAGHILIAVNTANKVDISDSDVTFVDSVGIGTVAIDASAILQMDSTTQGALAPRMTTAQKNAIGAPATGLLVYDTNLNDLQFYNGAVWKGTITGFIDGSGTVNTIPLYSDADTITDSSLSHDGSANILIATGKGFIDATQTDSVLYLEDGSAPGITLSIDALNYVMGYLGMWDQATDLTAGTANSANQAILSLMALESTGSVGSNIEIRSDETTPANSKISFVNDTLHRFVVGGADIIDVDSGGLEIKTGYNLEIGEGGIGGAGTNVLSILNGTDPAAGITNGIEIYSKDATADAALATLSLYLEQSPVAIGAFTPSHKIAVWINGTEYHIQLDAV
jgi:hypothetical protein